MNQKQEKQNIQPQKKELSLSVLERIEKENVTLVPKWRFLFNEYAIWVLWGVSVLFGSIAVSVMLYVSMHAGFAMYEATHETPLSFFVEVLPVLWVGVFVAMAVLAYINMRKTKKGYRYPLWHILMSSLLFSIVSGGILHAAGVGYLIDTELSKKMPVVHSLKVTEENMWQSPERGRMLGMYISEAKNEEEILFEDHDKNTWIVNIHELMPKDIELLTSGNRVRIMGLVASSTEAAYFYGCAVFPWMFDAPVVLSDMRKERESFMERIELHESRIQRKIQQFGEKIERFEEKFEKEEEDEKENEMMCPTMPIIKRFTPEAS